MANFTARKIKSRFVQQLQAPPAKVFPLLCPVREYEWIEPWQCEILHSESGIAEKNCVFRTSFPGESSDDVWIISHYEPDTRIEFVRVNALRIACLSITLTDGKDGTTHSLVEQLLVGLTEEGNRSMDVITESFSLEWAVGEVLLNHYLTTGKSLPLQDALASLHGRIESAIMT